MPVIYSTVTPWWFTTGPSVTLWDSGLTWRTEQVSYDEDFLALDVDYVKEKVLRVVNGDTEDEFIEGCIRAATELCESRTFTNIIPRQLALVANGVPTAGIFELRGHPVRQIHSVEYYDSDNALTVLPSVSPATWIYTGSGLDLPATVQPLSGEDWPTSYARSDAFRITYDVGYPDANDIPHMTRMGIALVAGELYKNRDLSNDMGQVPNVLGLDSFWPRRW